MKKKSAKRFAESLAGFLSTAPEAEVISEDDLNIAKILIPAKGQFNSNIAPHLAEHIRCDRIRNGDKAEVWDFDVTDEDSNEEVVLRYYDIQEDGDKLYYLFEILEPERSNDSTDKQVEESISD